MIDCVKKCSSQGLRQIMMIVMILHELQGMHPIKCISFTWGGSCGMNHAYFSAFYHYMAFTHVLKCQTFAH